MPNKKMKKWSDLSISRQAAIEKQWNRIQKTKRKAGQKAYKSKSKSAWLRAKGISGGGNGIVRGTQRLKTKRRQYGE